jgi:hypothetical protein
MTRRQLPSRIPKTFRKPWNVSALAMSIVAIGLMLIAVFSIQIEPRRTGDYLEITNSKQHAAFDKNKTELGLLQRNIKKPVATFDHLNEGKGAGPAKPMKVKAGLYASNNYNINPQTPSFDSIGYIWFKWEDDLQDYLTKNKLQIWKVMTPINLLNIPGSSDSVFTPTSEPIRMKDGSWYLTASYKGTFYIDDTDFRYHPFTKLNLPIMIEADDILLNYDKLRIEPDNQGSGIGQFIDTSNGWVNTGWSLNSYKHHYDTDFGFGEGASDYSQLIYDIRYATSTWLAFWKILVPISIVMAMIVGATKLEPVHYDVRLTMPVTVLLTLVFLQQGHNSDLPRLSYLTFLDEVYVVCYALTLGAFILMLWACRRYYSALKIEDPEQQELAMRRLEKSDDYWPTYVILAGIISISIAWFTA